MKARLRPAVTFCTLLLACVLCEAKKHKRPSYCGSEETKKPLSFLWGLKRVPPSYFFGTIHVPYTRVWNSIPENAKRAFNQSDSVFFELDLTDSQTISALSKCQLLPNGENLADVLPHELFLRLKNHLDYVKLMIPSWMTQDQRGRGVYAEYLFTAITGNWQRKRPVWVMLMVNSLTESDVKSRGIPVLDLYLAQKASEVHKTTGAVERVHEQCFPLNGLNMSQVVFALNQTLQRQESIRSGEAQNPYTTDDLVKHYNCGDLNAVIFNQVTKQVPNLLNSSLSPLEIGKAMQIEEYFREELIYKRNRRMGERVSKLLQQYPDKVFFFAFGAGHLVGNYSVLHVLEEGGFQIEHIPPERKLKWFRKKHKNRATVPKFSLLQDFTPTNQMDGVPSPRFVVEQQSSRYHFTPPQSQRKFNDLWIRLNPTSSGYNLPQTPMKTDQVVQESLRAWSNSGQALYANYLITTLYLIGLCTLQRGLITQ